jgi:GNAT superfamily N-acetyltransferase
MTVFRKPQMRRAEPADVPKAFRFRARPSGAARDNSNMEETSKITAFRNIEVAQAVQQESRDVIARRLREFNAGHMGEYEWTGLDVYVRDVNGLVVGGLIGDVALGWFSIHALWVAEGLRGSGVGTGILKAAEEAAIQRGCRAAILDTLSFQAPAFYEKRGYVRIGVVDDYRGGTQRIFMQKSLKAVSNADSGES